MNSHYKICEEERYHHKIHLFELKSLFKIYFILLLLTVMLFGKDSVHIILTSTINIGFYLSTDELRD